MKLTVTALTARTLSTLSLFETTSQPQPWVAEVESFLLGPAAKEHIKGSGRLWLISNDALPVGLAASCPHTVFAAELLQALMIDPRHRGRGLGRPALAAVLHAVHDASTSDFVMWLVHPENTSMLELSRRVDPEGAQTESGGYFLFGYP